MAYLYKAFIVGMYNEERLNRYPIILDFVLACTRTKVNS
jgi:hypothetical protein